MANRVDTDASEEKKFTVIKTKSVRASFFFVAKNNTEFEIGDRWSLTVVSTTLLVTSDCHLLAS